jgi:RNA polymerase sigma factor (sigma-70 family)
MNNYCHSCGQIDDFVYLEVKKLTDRAAASYPDQSLLSCSKCGRGILIEHQIEPEGSVPLPTLNPATPTDLEQLVEILLPDVNDAVRWVSLWYQGRIREDELDDLSQQIILTLIEDNCRRFRSFSGQSSFKTWLQAVVNHHIYKYFSRRKQIEPLDEVDQESLTYSPLQDQGIDTAERRKLLFRALGKLSWQERLLYQLWFISELDAKEIAAIFRTEVKIIYRRKQTLVCKLMRLVQNFHSY